MSGYAERNARNRRLVVLRALSNENDGRLNETMIRTELDLFGHRVSRDQVRALLRWLEGVDAVRIEMVGEIMIAGITARGEDHVMRRGDPIGDIDLPSRL